MSCLVESDGHESARDGGDEDSSDDKGNVLFDLPDHDDVGLRYGLIEIPGGHRSRQLRQRQCDGSQDAGEIGVQGQAVRRIEERPTVGIRQWPWNRQ